MKTGLHECAISQLRRWGGKGIIEIVTLSFLRKKAADRRDYAKEAPILIPEETVHAVEGL